jgi:hypothetical protein
MKTGRKRSPCVSHTRVAWAHPWPCHLGVRTPRNSFPSRFPHVTSFRCIIFAYLIPRSPEGLYIIFSSCFVLSCFCQELISSLGEPWPLQVMTKAKDPWILPSYAKSGRRNKVLEEQGRKTLLRKDQQKLGVSFLMICRDQHIMFWILTPCP